MIFLSSKLTPSGASAITIQQIPNCQDCHMRHRRGFPCTGSTERPDNPGFASPEIMGGKKRPHIWTHYFVGGSATPMNLSVKDEFNEAIEYYENCEQGNILPCVA